MTDWTATHKSQAMEYWKMTGFVDSDAAYHEVTDKMNDYFGAGMFTKVAVMRYVRKLEGTRYDPRVWETIGLC